MTNKEKREQIRDKIKVALHIFLLNEQMNLSDGVDAIISLVVKEVEGIEIEANTDSKVKLGFFQALDTVIERLNK